LSNISALASGRAELSQVRLRLCSKTNNSPNKQLTKSDLDVLSQSAGEQRVGMRAFGRRDRRAPEECLHDRRSLIVWAAQHRDAVGSRLAKSLGIERKFRASSGRPGELGRTDRRRDHRERPLGPSSCGRPMPVSALASFWCARFRTFAVVLADRVTGPPDRMPRSHRAGRRTIPDDSRGSVRLIDSCLMV
jgi:hypothetical protein